MDSLEFIVNDSFEAFREFPELQLTLKFFASHSLTIL